MATLQIIGREGISGVKATPVNQIAINNYAVHNKFMAMQEFINTGMGTSSGNIATSVVTYDGLEEEAGFRQIGSEHTGGNATPEPKTIYLKNLGKEFSSDRAIQRGMADGNGNPFDRQQLEQALNQVINSFAKYSMIGDSTVNSEQFDGLNRFFLNFPNQVNHTAFDASGELNSSMSLRIERYINEAIAEVKDCNEIITTRKGATLLQAINAYRNRGVEVVEVNGAKYRQYMGIPIIEMPESYFDPAELLIGIPVICGYVNEFDGIRYAIPSDGQVFDIVQPGQVINGVFTTKGGIEIMTAPILVDRFVASKCYINEVGTGGIEG